MFIFLHLKFIHQQLIVQVHQTFHLTFQSNPQRWETAIVRAQFSAIIKFLSGDVLLLCFSTNFCYEL